MLFAVPIFFLWVKMKKAPDWAVRFCVPDSSKPKSVQISFILLHQLNQFPLALDSTVYWLSEILLN